MGAAHSSRQQQPDGQGAPRMAPAQGHGAPAGGSNGRVVVDIRGASLDHNYSVWIEKQPHYRRKTQEVEVGVNSVSGMLQALGGVLITALTIHKLVEEVRVMRALRRSARNGTLGGAIQGGGPDGTQGPAQHETAVQPAGTQRNLPPPDFGTNGAATDSSSGAGTSTSQPEAQAVSWRAVSGLTGVKMLLQEATVLPMLRPDMFTGVRQPPKGVLLYGPPGTGKTLLARAVAAESGAAFLPVTGSSVLSKWFGESEANVRRLFEDARQQAPAVVFIDEVDSLLGRRSGDGGPAGASEASRRVTNEFLSFIDGIQTNGSRIVVIAATNAPWDIDEAALSRFNARVLVPLPSKEARVDILRRAMDGVAIDMSDADWLAVSDRAGKYSGRDLMSVCREASMRPLRELWNGRILESTSAELHQGRQHKQLVGAVVEALTRGAAKKRIRKELDKWKKTHTADWCNVDTVLAEAQQQHEGTSSSGSAAPAAAPAATAAAAAVAGVAAAAASPMAAGASSNRAATVAAMSSAAGAVASGLATFSQQQAGHGSGGSDVWLNMATRQQQQQQGSSSGLGSAVPCAVGNSGADAAILQQHAPQAKQQRSQPTSSSTPAPASSSAAQALPARAGTPTGGSQLCSHAISEDAFLEEQEEACSSLREPKGQAPSLQASSREAPAPATPAAAATAAAAPAAAAGPAAPISTMPSKPSGSNNNSSGDAWTVDELLALPTECVRPVRLEDFEWALQQVASTEFDLSARFEEWDQQYGSGGGAKREREWKHMPMYL